MEDIHNLKRRHERIIERIKESDIPKENKALLLEFNDYLISEGIGFAKIERYLQDLIKFNGMLQKSFKDATEQDIRRVVSELNQSNLSEETKKGFKLIIRKFYRFIRGIDEKGVYPPEVKWISLKISKKHSKLPEELLTEEEMLKIIQNCETIRDKTLVATLCESGARVGEIAMMKIKHVSFEEYGARLTLGGKTGMRKILVISSMPYLQEWINAHPHNTNPDAYLWYNPQGEFLCYTRIVAILKKATKRAGIKKRVHPHLFRHSRATRLVSVMSEPAMKQYFGWTPNSNMTSIYIHLSGKDVDDAILRANGIEIKKDSQESKLKQKICIRCKTKNKATSIFCDNCGMVLNQDKANELIKADSERNKHDNILNQLLEDEDFLNLMVKKIKEKKLIS